MQPDSGNVSNSFTEKFIGFVDVLGFSNLVIKAESGEGIGLDQIRETLVLLGSPADREKLVKLGPSICPQSAYEKRDLDFRLTQISDCVIVSSEISPAGVISLLNHCWVAVMRLLEAGFMCRGYIIRGRIFHDESQVIGTGYQKAYESERAVSAFKSTADERGTPFVELDRSVADYINSCGDSCVQEMFSRMVKADDEIVALFPFKRLAHSFVVLGHQPLNVQKERRSNENVRTMLCQLKDKIQIFVDQTNSNAVMKVAHYLRSLDAQLAVCDQTEAFLQKFDSKPRSS